MRSADLALFFPVAFVADEDLVDAFGCVLLDVGEPGAYVCEVRVSMLGFLTVELLACWLSIVRGGRNTFVTADTEEVDCNAATATAASNPRNIAAHNNTPT